MSVGATSDRICYVTATGAPAPIDPVGAAAAQFLTDLLDGFTVEVHYWKPPAAAPMINELAHRSIARRAGPPGWNTMFIVDLLGQSPDLYGVGAGPFHWLPHEVGDLPKSIVEAADAIGTQSGLDGSAAPDEITRGVLNALVVELLAQQLADQSARSGQARAPAAFGLSSRRRSSTSRRLGTRRWSESRSHTESS